MKRSGIQVSGCGSSGTRRLMVAAIARALGAGVARVAECHTRRSHLGSSLAGPHSRADLLRRLEGHLLHSQGRPTGPSILGVRGLWLQGPRRSSSGRATFSLQISVSPSVLWASRRPVLGVADVGGALGVRMGPESCPAAPGRLSPGLREPGSPTCCENRSACGRGPGIPGGSASRRQVPWRPL